MNSLSVDTDLKDLSPKISSSPHVSQAIDSLSENAKKRIFLLIKAIDEEQLSDAVEEINAQILSLETLNLDSSDQLQSQAIELLKPYRFNFLTSKQTSFLAKKTIAELVDVEQRKLYRLGEGPRLLPFDQDPLAWFSEYILDVFSTLQLSSSPDQDKENYFALIPLVISDSVNSMNRQEILLSQLDSIGANAKATYEIEIQRSGLFFFAIDAAKKSKKDIHKIAIGSMLGVLVLMILVFRSLAPLFVSFVSIFLGVGFAVAVTYSVFGKIHVLTIVFGASLIGIVIDYSLHYFFHQFSQTDNMRTSIANRQASRNKLTRAMILSVTTSLIGFSALAFSDLQSLKKVAVFSCSGLIMAWLAVMSLGTIVRAKQSRHSVGPLDASVSLLQSILTFRPKLLLYFSLVLLGVSTAYILSGGVNINDDPRLFFKASPQLIKEERYIRQYTSGIEANRYLFVSGRSTSEVYKRLSEFHEEAASSGNTQIFSILDVLPSIYSQNKNYDLQKKLYGENAVVEQLLDKIGAGKIAAAPALSDYKKLKNRVITPKILQDALPQLPPMWSEINGEFYAYIFFKHKANHRYFNELANRLDGIQYVDIIKLTSGALQEQRRSASSLLIAAYFLVALLMLLYYRKVSAVLLLAIPIGATIFTICLLSIIGQAITIFHVMALFLVLGLGMDYVIFASEMREHDNITMQAILLSAITTLMSFGLLSFSSMPIVQAFGSTLLIGNTINLLATMCIFKIKKNERINSYG